MPRVIRLYVQYVDALSTVIGRITMWLIFMMMGILLYSAIARTFFNLPLLWAVEMSQFTMAAYFLVGGAYSMILHGHVRMDLLYHRWPRRRQAGMDVLTDFLLIFYLVILIVGGVSSIQYALEYDQTSYSAWRPPLAPIKIIMVSGIVLMLLQAISTLFKDLAAAIGRPLDE